MKYDLTVIIPCFNSDKYIYRNFIKLNSIIKRYFKNVEYYLINDGSSDKTLIKLIHLKKKIKNVKIINLRKNSGKSYGIRFCLKLSNGKKILLCDDDIPYIKYLQKLLMKLKVENLVIINRRHENSKITIQEKKFYHNLRNIIGNMISHIGYNYFKIPVKDTQAGLKGFSNSLSLKRKNFTSNIFFLDIELIKFFEKKNVKIFEIPVNYVLEKNKSSINLFDLKKNFEIFLEYLKVIKNI